MFKNTIVTFLFCLGISAGICADTIPVPEINGPWWKIAGNPDLGPYTSDQQQPVDFGIWQASDGTWQLWSCIRKTNCGGNTRLFYRWEGKNLTDSNWEPKNIAMLAEPNFGESLGGLQAPYTIKLIGKYFMFYGDWENICLATSMDGKTFSRQLNEDGKSGMFSQGAGNNARDPMILMKDNKFYCYYTAHPNKIGAIYCRISTDFKTWSESYKVSFGGEAGTSFWSHECPHVVAYDGVYYLFATQMYGKNARTTVFRSDDPLDFGKDSDEYRVGQLPVAAPEVIQHKGHYYIASLRPDLQGIQLAHLVWIPK